MSVPDFLHIACTTTDRPECASCGREFLVPISAVAAFQRRGDNRANVFLKREVFGSGNCIGNTREFKTTMLWPDLVDLLNGSVEEGGDVQVEQRG